MNLSASKGGGGESSNQDLSTAGADEHQSYQDCSREINRLSEEDLQAYRRMQWVVKVTIIEDKKL